MVGRSAGSDSRYGESLAGPVARGRGAGKDDLPVALDRQRVALIDSAEVDRGLTACTERAIDRPGMTLRRVRRDGDEKREDGKEPNQTGETPPEPRRACWIESHAAPAS